tara:strand:- start:642 stop:749 length:108 start_codon:yes stop_codon:yes gene_type:complete
MTQSSEAARMTDPLLDRDALALAGQLEAARPWVHR